MEAVLETLQGWGRFRSSRSLVHRPTAVESIQRLVQGAESGGLITRGLGRSYGDAAQASDAAVLDLGAFNWQPSRTYSWHAAGCYAVLDRMNSVAIAGNNNPT